MLGCVADLVFLRVSDKTHITGLNLTSNARFAGFPSINRHGSSLLLARVLHVGMSKGRYKEAYHSMCHLGGQELLAARDLYYIFVLLEEEASIVRNHNRHRELFSIGRNRRAVIGSSLFSNTAA